MDKYIYRGPVMVFNNIVDPDWQGVTCAVSAAKAKSNLMYRWKKANGLTAQARVTLPGKIILESDYGRNH